MGVLVVSAICGAFGGFLFYKGTANIWLSSFAALISMTLLLILAAVNNI
jgi:hypothetical protein